MGGKTAGKATLARLEETMRPRALFTCSTFVSACFAVLLINAGCGGPDFSVRSSGPEAGDGQDGASETPATVVICSPCPDDNTSAGDATTFVADTNATISFGLSNEGTTGSGWTVYFDKVIATVQR